MATRIRKLTVYPILHSIKDFTGKGTPESARLLKRLRQLKEQGVKRVGFEIGYRKGIDDIFGGPGNEYTKIVYWQARKHGIELVPLEDEPHEKAMGLLHRILLDAFTEYTRRRWPNSYTREFVEHRKTNILKNKFEKHFPEDKIVPALIEKIGLEFDFNHHDLSELSHAISYYRSIRMRRKALAQGLEHIAIGGGHAEDLKSTYGNRGVEVDYITIPYPTYPFSPTEEIRDTEGIQAYKKHWRFVNALARTAKQEAKKLEAEQAA